MSGVLEVHVGDVARSGVPTRNVKGAAGSEVRGSPHTV